MGHRGEKHGAAMAAQQSETSLRARRVVHLTPAQEREADAVRVLYRHVNVPLFVGDGELDYACHQCFQVVCERISPGDLAGIIVRCSCGSVNRVPAVA